MALDAGRRRSHADEAEGADLDGDPWLGHCGRKKQKGGDALDRCSRDWKERGSGGGGGDSWVSFFGSWKDGSVEMGGETG